jgi:hypothetical protein
VQAGGIYTWHLADQPAIDLVLNIPAKSLSISALHDGSTVDIDKMRNCYFKIQPTSNDEASFSLVVSPVEDWYAYYSFLEMVAKKIIAGQNHSAAIQESIEIWNNLVLLKPTLGQEQEVGLIGELLFLEFLLGNQGTDSLVNWTGPEREEHDFKFNGFDIEVKTTTQELRIHQIGSLSQLKETPGKALFLLSNQITKTGANGFTLSELVNRISLTLSPGLASGFTDKLTKCKYFAADAALYKTRWELRTAPKFFAVTDSFPRLLSDTLGLPPEIKSLVSDVSYRINIEGIETSNQPFPKYGGSLTEEKHE